MLDLTIGGGDVQAFIGQNGAGKTNLIDAIALLSLTRSAQGLEDADLVCEGTEFYRVRGAVRSDDGTEETLELVCQMQPRRQKAAFRNDVRIPVSGLIGRLPTAVFLPQDLELFTGPPGERRRFLDRILCQVSPEHDSALSEYTRLLKQRNTLLHHIADGRAKEGELDLWDAEIAKAGGIVTVSRLELIETFALTLSEELKSLGERWTATEIAYRRSGRERERGAVQRELQSLLLSARPKDLLLQSTTVGPHRDDWGITVDGAALATRASRGQQRSAVLALLFLEASFLEIRRGERPVILLDDIFSELDDAHRERVCSAFPLHQVLLTGTHLPPVGGKAKVWRVEEGKIVA